MIDLYRGDCLEVMNFIPDNSIDFIATDPPYKALKHKIETDVDIPAFLNECKRVLKKDGFLAYFGQQPGLTEWNYHAFKIFNYKNEVIWYKRQGGSPMLDMNRMFENITIVCNGKRKFNDVKLDYTDLTLSLAEFMEKSSFDRKLSALNMFIEKKDKLNNLISDMSGNRDYRINGKTNEQGATVQCKINKTCPTINMARVVLNGYAPRNLISFRPHNRARLDRSGKGGGSHNVKHPTVKPIPLMDYLIQLCSNEGDLIIDPFMGSGTTGKSALKLNRNFIGVELDSDYFEIAKQRIFNND